MATKKNKKNVTQFKQALFSNTGFIQEPSDTTDTKKTESNVSNDIIEPEILNKIEILAAFEGVDKKEMINKALNHFLRLKGLQLEEAMKQKK